MTLDTGILRADAVHQAEKAAAVFSGRR